VTSPTCDDLAIINSRCQSLDMAARPCRLQCRWGFRLLCLLCRRRCFSLPPSPSPIPPLQSHKWAEGERMTRLCSSSAGYTTVRAVQIFCTENAILCTV